MAIQESDPARRNLYVVSLAFIVYALAGGEFGKEIHLPLINLHFNKPHVLAVFAWIFLFWFAFRYWQSRDFSWGEIFKQDVQCIKKGFARLILTKILSICKKEKIILTNYHAVSVTLQPLKIEFGTQDPNKEQCLNPFYAEKKDCSINSKTASLLIKAFLLINRTMAKPNIISHLLPYWLFTFALYLNIHSLIEIVRKIHNL